MHILKSYRNAIPGNYFYIQTEGIRHTFAAQPHIEPLAQAVSGFRIANRLSRASIPESLEDIDKFNCAIRGNDPKYCYECHTDFESARSEHPYFKKGCASCGKPTVKT